MKDLLIVTSCERAVRPYRRDREVCT